MIELLWTFLLQSFLLIMINNARVRINYFPQQLKLEICAS